MSSYIYNLFGVFALCGFIFLFIKNSRFASVVRFAFGICIISAFAVPLLHGNFEVPEMPEIKVYESENATSVITLAGENLCKSVECAIEEYFGVNATVQCDLDITDRSNVAIEEIRITVPTGDSNKIISTVKELTSCERVKVIYGEVSK